MLVNIKKFISANRAKRFKKRYGRISDCREIDSKSGK